MDQVKKTAKNMQKISKSKFSNKVKTNKPVAPVIPPVSSKSPSAVVDQHI